MSTTHTPGPWSILFSQSGYPYQIHAANGDDTKPGAVGTSVTRWGAISLPSSAEGLANARLIASAPELLEALQRARSVIEGAGYPVDVSITRAIAKATGVAQ